MTWSFSWTHRNIVWYVNANWNQGLDDYLYTRKNKNIFSKRLVVNWKKYYSVLKQLTISFPWDWFINVFTVFCWYWQRQRYQIWQKMRIRYGFCSSSVISKTDRDGNYSKNSMSIKYLTIVTYLWKNYVQGESEQREWRLIWKTTKNYFPLRLFLVKCDRMFLSHDLILLSSVRYVLIDKNILPIWIFQHF